MEESIKKKMIEASQRMITINSQGEGELGGMNPAIKKHLELEIKTLLQNAPRDADKLKRLLQSKEREKNETMHIKDIERLVTKIDMLKVVLYLMLKRRKISSTRPLFSTNC